MQALFAGFVSGYLLSVLWTILAAGLLMRSRHYVVTLSQRLPPRLAASAVMAPLLLFLSLLMTALGLILGLVYLGFEEASPQGGLGSANLAFTVLVAVSPVLILMAVVTTVRRRPPAWPYLALGLTFTAVFGWLMPYLAEA